MTDPANILLAGAWLVLVLVIGPWLQERLATTTGQPLPDLSIRPGLPQSQAKENRTMATPVNPSIQTQQLIAAAGQAAADDAQSQATVAGDQAAITALNQQLAQAGTTLAGDQQAAQAADAANNAAYIAVCQSLAVDYQIPLPQTIPVPAPVSPAPVAAKLVKGGA